MFTKKTRALSVLLVICMVISLLTCFTFPAFAAADATKLAELQGMVDRFDANGAYWAQYAKDGEDITDILAEVKEKLSAANYADDDAVTADLTKLYNAYINLDPSVPFPASYKSEAVTLSVGTIPAVTAGSVEGNATNFPNVGIYTEADLNYAGSKATDYNAGQKLHLMADITISDGSTFVGIQSLESDFDGHNHTIRNFNATTQGFFDGFKGSNIENIKFDNCHTKNLYKYSALVIGCRYDDDKVKHTLTIQNVEVTNSSVFRITTTDNSTNRYYQGILMGISSNNEVLKNITIRNCEVKGRRFENTGILVGAFANGVATTTPIEMENIIIDNCDLNSIYYSSSNGKLLGYSSAFLVGCVKDNSLNVKNVIVTNNTSGYYDGETLVTDNVCAKGTLVGDVMSTKKVSFENVLAYGNDTVNLATKDFTATTTNSASLSTLTFKNAYADNKYAVMQFGSTLTAVNHDTYTGFNRISVNENNVPATVHAVNKSIGSPVFTLDEQGRPAFATGASDALYKLTVTSETEGYDCVVYGKPGQALDLKTILHPALINAETMALVSGTAGTFEDGDFALGQGDAEYKLTYTRAPFDFDYVKTLKAVYAPYNAAYFEEAYAQKLLAVQNALQAILDAQGTDKSNESFYDDLAVVQDTLIPALEAATPALKVTTATLNEKLDTACVPNYTEKALYEAWNTKNVWGVASKEDWIGLTEAGAAVANANIYFKANIDMNNINVKPLCFGTTFNGNLFGNGYYFENLKISQTAKGDYDGIALISAVGENVKVLELGVKSGMIEMLSGPKSGWYGVAVFAGRCGTSSVTDTSKCATFYKCWAGKDVKIYASTELDTGYSTFIARGGAHIESCYSLATVAKQALIFGSLSGWSQKNTTIRNSYAVFSGIAPSWNQKKFEIVRSGNSPAQNRLENSYGVGSDVGVVCTNDAELKGNNFAVLDKNTTAGELAYTLNKNYAADRGEGAYVPEKVYWTVEDDTVVYGTEATQTRKLVLTATGANNEQFIAYGKEGDTVDLKTLLGLEEIPADKVSLEADSAGSLNGSVFTFGKGDGNVTTSVKFITDADYDTMAQLYAKHPEFYGNTVKEALDSIKENLEKEQYDDQSELDADLKAAAALFAVTSETIVPAGMNREAVTLLCGETIGAVSGLVGSTTYLNLGIYNVNDLIYAAHGPNGVLEFSKAYGKNQTIHLMTNLDMTGHYGTAAEGKFQRFHDLTAKFDGHDYTITNWNPTGAAAFFAYPKNVIQNMHFKDCNPTVGGQGALVVSQYAMGSTGVSIENILIENCTVKTAGQYVAGVVLGDTRAKTVVIKNVTLRNTKITAATTNTVGYTESSGLLIGRMREGGTVTVENVLIEGCENTNGKHDGVGLLFGVLNQLGAGSESANVVTVDGLILRNNIGNGIEAVLGGAWQRPGTAKKNSFNLKNALIYGNNTGSAPLLNNFNATTATVDVNFVNVVTDVTNMNYSGTTLNANVLSAAAFENGHAAYEANKNATLFKVDAAGNIYFAAKAPEASVAPVKVSFTKGAEEKIAFYTGGNGDLLNADVDAVKALYNCKVTNTAGEDADVAAILAANYTAGAEFNLFDHGYTYVNSADGKHIATCELCGLTKEENCDKLADAELEGDQVIAPTEEVEGCIRHLCSLCKTEWHSDVLPKVIGVKVENGISWRNEATVPVALKNNPALKGLTITVDYDATRLSFKEILFAEELHLMSNVMDGKVVAVAAKASAIKLFKESVNGEPVLFKLVFTPVEGAPAGDAEITVNVEVVDEVTDYIYISNAGSATMIDTDLIAAQGVDAMIEALNVQTLKDEAAVLAVREAYTALTDSQKALVTKLEILVAAEAELAAIKAEVEGLAAYITAIEAAKNGLEVIDKDASAVAKGVKFITTEELAAFEAAVAEAKAAECMTKTEVAAVKAALDAAKVTLLAAVKEGTFVAIIEADELKNDFLYKDGVRINNYVLAMFKGVVYFVSDYHRIEKDQLRYIGESYLLGTDYKPGYYYFNAEGVMSVANGPVGNLFLIDGVIQDAYKVYSYGENFYYTTDSRRLAKNTVVYLSTAVLAGTGLAEGYYAFDENGVMTAANGAIGDYFYKEGTRVQAYTLVTDGEDIYYVSDYHKLAKNKKIYLTKDALAKFGKTLPSAYYDFDADGKLILHEGPVGDFFYINGARQNAYQVYRFGEDYYYTSDYHKLVKGKRIYLSKSVIGTNDLLPGYYDIDENGKILIFD